jgi:ABC-type branched-subunit amino acid transport system permease subunit
VNATTARGLGSRGQSARQYLARHQSLSILIGMAIVAVVLPILAAVPPFSSFGPQSVFVFTFADAGVFVLLALGLNVVVGLAGLLDLGYVAFFVIGAYTMAYGDYLAIVTLGFGEIVPAVFLNADTFTNGTNGITGIAQPDLYGLFGLHGFGFTNPWPYYVVMLLIVTVAMMLLYRLQDSRLGRAWVAIREDELAAASMGINTVSTKLLAFAIGATTSGFAGVFYASKLGSVTPEQFDFTISFTALAMVVLGGMGNIWGVGVGAFIIYLLQRQALKQLTDAFHSLNLSTFTLGPVTINPSSIDFTSFQYLLYGLALVLMMLLRPEGLFPSRRRRQELHEAAAEVEATAEIVSEA